MDAPSDDDTRTLVESSRGESLMERCRLNLVVNRESSFFSSSWPGEQLDWLVRKLLSRVMSVASGSLVALPPAEVSFENDAALPVSSQSAPPHPLAFLDVDGFFVGHWRTCW